MKSLVIHYSIQFQTVRGTLKWISAHVNHFFWESICDKDIFMAKQFHTVLFSNSNKCYDCEKLHPSNVANTVQTKHYHQKKPMGYLTKWCNAWAL